MEKELEQRLCYIDYLHNGQQEKRD